VAHEPAVGDPDHVVGKCDGSGIHQIAVLVHRLAFHPLAQGSRRMKAGKPDPCPPLTNQQDGTRSIGSRSRVRHADHVGEPAGGRGRRSTGNGLGVLESGLPEMRAQIEETRRHDQPRPVDSVA